MPLTPLPLMLFAAGFGTRMGALTRDRPKPLIPVAGRPLIDHALDLATEVGADPIVVNLHYYAEMLRAHLAGRNVIPRIEAPDILDTGGGLRAALPDLGTGPVATLNPDVIWRGPNPLMQLRAAWNPAVMDALLVCVPLHRCVGRTGAGDFSADADGQLRRGGNLVYGGAQILKTELLHDMDAGAFSLNRVWDVMAQENRLYSVEYDGKWCDVGRPEGIELAETLLAAPHV